jgi:hypothetical protein
MQQEFEALQAKMGRPVPGQSLTNDPENPAPFERPPEFTSIHEASEYLFIKLTEEDTYVPVMQAVASGYPLAELSQVILFKGFTEGKWNPDLMTMLIEPTIYMLLALAERIGVDPVIYLGEDEDEIADEQTKGTKFEEKAFEAAQKLSVAPAMPPGVFTSKMKERLEEVPDIPDEVLLGPANEELEEETEEVAEETTATESLLAPPEQ